MNKKYIIAVAVSIVLFVGFMIYRSHQKAVEGDAYREKQTDHMLAIARQSPRGGLGKLGRALKSYYADNGSYPAKLIDLYPGYIATKPFLTEIEWYYEPKGVDFYLSKTTYIKDRKLVAYIDNRLKPTTEKEIMVARPTPVTRIKPLKRRASLPQKSAKEELSRLALARKQFFEALGRGQIGVGSVYSPQDDEVRLISTLIPEVLATGREVSDVDIESELSRNYLVWKDAGGTLGFGNIQYPSTDRLAIFAIGQWYNLKMPPKKAAQVPLPQEWETQRTPETVAAALNRKFLVWKDGTGTVGFGNTAYPAEGLNRVLLGDTWQPLHTGDETGISGQDDSGEKAHDVSRDEKVSEFARQYLVWKEGDGTLGFGNVQYPRKGSTQVFQRGDWMEMGTQGHGAAMETDEALRATAEEPSPELASRFGRQFLVWKDTNGTVGFGNTEYPRQGVSAIYQPGRWTEASHLETDHSESVDAASPKETPPPGTLIASKLSARYLVWKDQGGTVGFGNLQYPEGNAVSSVCINGDWHPVSTPVD